MNLPIILLTLTLANGEEFLCTPTSPDLDVRSKSVIVKKEQQKYYYERPAPFATEFL